MDLVLIAIGAASLALLGVNAILGRRSPSVHARPLPISEDLASR